MSVWVSSSFKEKALLVAGNLDSALEFRSGAIYEGDLRDNTKEGQGTFLWPNGDCYEGEFKNNKREGIGKQIWGDGDSYTGSYQNDKRHGWGVYTWNTGDKYEGSFYKDHRHGKGRYTWQDGSSYTGTFYMDRKEGYGVFSYVNGEVFEGLYKQDEREGPGVLTYPDGRQDVGYWHREHLLRLLVELPKGFSLVTKFPEFSAEVKQQATTITEPPIGTFEPNDPLFDLLGAVVNPPDLLNYDPKATSEVRRKLLDSVLREDTDQTSKLFNRGSMDAIFVRLSTPQGEQKIETLDNRQDSGISSTPGTPPPPPPPTQTKPKKPRVTQASKKKQKKKSSPSKPPPEEPSGPVAWNTTSTCLTMQRHFLRFACLQPEPTQTCDFKALLDGKREKFGPVGPLETNAMELFRLCQAGEYRPVKRLLSTRTVDPNVADSAGRTPLLEATINWHIDIVNTLLDAGADVNKLSDEGLSSLAACLVHLYPTSEFETTMAETSITLAQNAPTTESKMNSPASSHRSQDGHPPMDDNKENGVTSKPPSEGSGVVRLPEFSTPADKWDFSCSNIDTDDLYGKRVLPDVGTKRRRRGSFDDDSDEDSESRSVADPATTCLATDCVSTHSANDFDSRRPMVNYPITVTDQLVERCATGLSTNELVVGRRDDGPSSSDQSDGPTREKTRDLARTMSKHSFMGRMARQLLKRGADPNASSIPMPPLFLIVRSQDVDMVRQLILKGVDVNATLPNEKGGLTPLHLAVCMPGDTGVQITSMLLDALADPNARAALDTSFLDSILVEEWLQDPITPQQQTLLGGRTPLHIACARDDDYTSSQKIIQLLLDHRANPNLLCNGHSALSLAIATGNDASINDILIHGANPSLALSHGMGSALCIASSTIFEFRRTVDGRLDLLNSLINAGADILSPIAVGPRRSIGTAVDYAYHMYNLDRRIAHMPYHALSPVERETFNARRRLLAHMGNLLREYAVAREIQRIEALEREGMSSRGPSPAFSYTGAGAVPPQVDDRGVSFADDANLMQRGDLVSRKPLLKYCYECGRIVGVRLTACTRCKEVFFCSKACKMKAWNARHKDECIRVGGRATSGKTRMDSPTPVTEPEYGRPKPTVPNFLKEAKEKRVQ